MTPYYSLSLLVLPIKHAFLSFIMQTGYLCKVIPAAEARKPHQGLSTMREQESEIVDRVCMQRGA